MLSLSQVVMGIQLKIEGDLFPTPLTVTIFIGFLPIILR